MGDRVARGLLAVALVCAGVAPLSAEAQEAAAAADVGTIAGVVLDKSSGDPVIEAGVEVVELEKTVRTDLDGKFSVKAPPGAYQVRVFAPLYQSVRLPAVRVVSGKTADVKVSLAGAGKAGIEVVEVVAQANRAAEATQLLQRKAAPVVMDTISAETMKKSTGSDAADVVKRAPAVTIKDEKYINVRGLDESYTGATLNGSRLPSTDPLKRAVPLDLFPASFLESLGIVKSYTPDLPGNFSGGLADIRLQDFPETFSGGFSVATGLNTQATFEDVPTYDGAGAKDWVGLGAGFRDIPRGTPIDVKSLGDEQRAAVGRRFRDIWSTKSWEAPPNYGLDFNVGTSKGPFGFQLGGLYSTEWKRRDEVKRTFRQGGDAVDPSKTTFITQDDFRTNVSNFETKLGGVFTAAYKPAPNHKLTLRTLVNHQSNDETQTATGMTQNFPGQEVDLTKLQYTEEQLAFGQLAGEHRFDRVWIDWRGALARTKQDQPDVRHTTYVGPVGGPLTFSDDSLGGTRFFRNLHEELNDDALDITIPFRTRLPFTDVWDDLPGKLKFGPAYTYRHHDFEQRRFRYRAAPGSFDLTLPPEDILAPANLGPGGVDFVETTLPADLFAAKDQVTAGYGMIELPIVRDRLRVIGGARVERSLIRLHTFGLFQDGAFLLGDQPITIDKKNTDILPGVNVVFSPRDDMNIRGGWSQSVRRPEFRELAPVRYEAPRGELTLIGNPSIVQSEIESWDFRWEWFFSPLELVSFGFFYKSIDKPIEQVVLPESSNLLQSWQNALDGTVYGFEAELRKNFGFVSSHLEYLTFLTNVTYSESEVNIAPSQRGVLTSLQRSLQGQAPFIVNAALDYTHPRWGSFRLLYYTAGARIWGVAAFLLPDIMEERRDQLDAVLSLPLEEYLDVPLTAKLSAENITNDTVVLSQGPHTFRRFSRGVKLGIGLSYAF
jgi:hypothetical protein